MELIREESLLMSMKEKSSHLFPTVLTSTCQQTSTLWLHLCSVKPRHIFFFYLLFQKYTKNRCVKSICLSEISIKWFKSHSLNEAQTRDGQEQLRATTLIHFWPDSLLAGRNFTSQADTRSFQILLNDAFL